MKGITKSGFEWDIDVQKLDDWEILEQLSDMEEGNMLSAPKFLKKLLGGHSKELVEHCRQEDGVVPTKKVLDEVFDIFGSLKEGKN